MCRSRLEGQIDVPPTAKIVGVKEADWAKAAYAGNVGTTLALGEMVCGRHPQSGACPLVISTGSLRRVASPRRVAVVAAATS